MKVPAHTVKCLRHFDRKTLRTIRLMKGSDGTFCTRIHILDRDSLQVSIVNYYWLESTLTTLVGMYLGEFFPAGKLRLKQNNTIWAEEASQ